MVDFLYSVLTRPIPNEPDKKNHYAINPTYKDSKSREISEDDPKNQHQHAASKDDDTLEVEPEEKDETETNSKGKGVYRDNEGRRHLDFYA
ncbi:hypothetical protein KO525_01765 [Psychrosphaera sp. B3R10]|uniref:hypothetical protein n=1 Tax=unclassified Psychrosphaera TaxID=2641570 RepID=UPI001C081130|nr:MULTISPECIES: hypothetical protein [unclassified Psychrosphaera]MBU2883025.1 hypothetical protein [Psychrosphaera sp. I2R16]MBU2988101.1 hypothetical protein [Psychrosphaera sp. B3R10]